MGGQFISKDSFLATPSTANLTFFPWDSSTAVLLKGIRQIHKRLPDGRPDIVASRGVTECCKFLSFSGTTKVVADKATSQTGAQRPPLASDRVQKG